jgi:hypothetical protein
VALIYPVVVTNNTAQATRGNAPLDEGKAYALPVISLREVPAPKREDGPSAALWPGDRLRITVFNEGDSKLAVWTRDTNGAVRR